jgi:hypothetical protein
MSFGRPLLAPFIGGQVSGFWSGLIQTHRLCWLHNSFLIRIYNTLAPILGHNLRGPWPDYIYQGYQSMDPGRRTYVNNHERLMRDVFMRSLHGTYLHIYPNYHSRKQKEENMCSYSKRSSFPNGERYYKIEYQDVWCRWTLIFGEIY